MKILIYVEPWIQMGNPLLRDVWVYLHSYRPLEGLNAWYDSIEDASPKYRFIIGDSIQYGLSESGLTPPRNVTFTVIEQPELWKIFPNYRNALRSWLDGSYSEDQLEAMCGLLAEKLLGYAPDIIISFTPAPFLQHLFPDSLVLYKEYGIFSRAPYPESWFLDCCGIGKNSFLVKYREQINAERPSEAGKAMLEKLRGLYLDDVLTGNNEYQALVDNYRNQYSSLVLLPLQVTDCYMFYCHCDFSDQFEYLCYVLHHLSDDIGVVITEHPDFPELTPEHVKYLRHTYKNFIYHPEFRKCYGVSQFLLGNVDAVVTVSSSIGLQALLWKKPLFVIGDSHLSAFSETRDFREAGEVLARGGYVDRDGALCWLLEHYYLSDQYYWNGRWLSGFFERSLVKHRANSIDFSFYEPIDSIERITGSLCSSARQDETGQPLTLRLHRNTAPV